MAGAERVRVHTPSGVVLPESLKLERTYPSGYDGQKVAGSKGYKPHTADRRTLIYDLFRSPDGRKLHAIGPDPRNLLKELWPLTISVDGERLRFKQRIEGEYGRVEPKPRLLFLEIALPPHLARRGQLEIEFQWRGFAAEVAVNPAAARGPKPLLNLAAIQKNNPLEWIRDWCLYYHRVHKVARIVLYDNASDDFDALRNELERLDDGLQVELVRWNYPYGAYRFGYAQRGALNHCYAQFKSATSHFLNFDVDEYLVNTSGMPLTDYLARKLRGNLATLRVRQRAVPNLPSGTPATGPLRAHHFRYRRSGGTAGDFKPIFTPRNISFVGVHAVNPAISRWLEPLMPRWAKRLIDLRPGVWRRVVMPSFRRSPYWLSHTMEMAPPGELYFNHYMGLNTHWKFDHERLAQPDPDLHEPDPVVPALLERVGLAEEGGA